MGPDDARLQDVRAWLAKARLDLKAAAHEASAPAEGLWGDVMFHAQQAAEKSLKAFLAWHDVPFRKTHNLEDLGQQCVKLDATLRPFSDQAAPLSEYAWKFRYPGEADEPERAEAELALAAARNIYEAVLTRLPEKACP
jgi:HEPN domain-containing protein